ncbi:hypothetical protein LSTR_LSTR016300 [Laodelphax striatellus]|uniref:Uncharacterized protein n=1 Tax=Laodelphax striatellus TaxID=195883 RepID=A0A482X862_LAOST|nr:hypothetical protein LSTR_LSTR012718 [Laodelphax striatellus]RZF41668.1 hypothetical protein LSTR_LSTR016300 [Laodelphax striatellus]
MEAGLGSARLPFSNANAKCAAAELNRRHTSCDPPLLPLLLQSRVEATLIYHRLVSASVAGCVCQQSRTERAP